MGRLLLVICLLLGLGHGARAQAPLDPPGFTQAFAKALATALPARSVTVVGDFQLKVRGEGREITVSLLNSYHDYKRDPKLLGVLVERHAAALAQRAGADAAPAALDRSRIVPVIKDREWLDESHRRIAQSGSPQQHIFEELNDELVVVYAEDSAARTRYLMTGEDVGAREDLRKRAVKNLLRLLPKIEIRRHDDVFALVTAGGDYEASLLLVEDVWKAEQTKFDGDLVVAVPAKDVLLVTGSRNRKGLAVVRKLVADFAGQERYRISDALFVYRDGRFKKFGRSRAGSSP